MFMPGKYDSGENIILLYLEKEALTTSTKIRHSQGFNMIANGKNKKRKEKELTYPNQKELQTSMNVVVEVQIYIPTIHPCKTVERKG